MKNKNQRGDDDFELVVFDLYDIITEFNGTTIENNDQLTEALAKCGAGQKVTCKVYRMNRDGSGKTVEITFVLEAAS